MLYARCLALDPSCDFVAAFNRANCFRALGETDEAATTYAHAIKIDPILSSRRGSTAPP